MPDFIRELRIAFDKIKIKNKLPIICGGTGLYLDTLHKDFSFTQIKENEILRKQLEILSKEELLEKFKTYTYVELGNVDVNSKKRLLRAIEIAEHLKNSPTKLIANELPYRPYYIGIKLDVEKRRELIYNRLIFRLSHGLIEEVEDLLKKGLTHERLQFFGLEYKFISFYLQQKISKEELILQLSTAINQFAKRQMTWFRKMEKEEIKINWIDKDADYQNLIKDLRSKFDY